MYLTMHMVYYIHLTFNKLLLNTYCVLDLKKKMDLIPDFMELI